jgi:hypothetical protein
VSGAYGIDDTEGKAVTESGERAGRQASFKFRFRFCDQKKSKKSLPFIYVSNKTGSITSREKSVDAFLML